jgi:hypothetical protein
MKGKDSVGVRKPPKLKVQFKTSFDRVQDQAQNQNQNQQDVCIDNLLPSGIQHKRVISLLSGSDTTVKTHPDDTVSAKNILVYTCGMCGSETRMTGFMDDKVDDSKNIQSSSSANKSLHASSKSIPDPPRHIPAPSSSHAKSAPPSASRDLAKSDAMNARLKKLLSQKKNKKKDVIDMNDLASFQSR